MTYKRAAIETLAAFAIMSLIFLLGYTFIAGCASMRTNDHERETSIRFERMNKYPYDWSMDHVTAKPFMQDRLTTARFHEEYVIIDSVMFSGRWVSPSLLEAYDFYDYRTNHGDMDSTVLFRVAVQPEVLKITLDPSLVGSGLERFERVYKLFLRYE